MGFLNRLSVFLVFPQCFPTVLDVSSNVFPRFWWLFHIGSQAVLSVFHGRPQNMQLQCMKSGWCEFRVRDSNPIPFPKEKHKARSQNGALLKSPRSLWPKGGGLPSLSPKKQLKLLPKKGAKSENTYKTHKLRESQGKFADLRDVFSNVFPEFLEGVSHGIPSVSPEPLHTQFWIPPNLVWLSQLFRCVPIVFP